jgi:hypothetical protein
MAELRPFLIGFLLAGLFAIALITGGIWIADLNNPDQSIGQDATLRTFASSLNQTLGQAHTDANSSYTAIKASPITLTTGFVVLDAIGGVWKTITIIPVAIYNLTIGLLIANVFSNPAFMVIFGVLSAIVILTIIFAVVKWLSQGEGG